jgi:hypothetical protein
MCSYDHRTDNREGEIEQLEKAGQWPQISAAGEVMTVELQICW